MADIVSDVEAMVKCMEEVDGQYFIAGHGIEGDMRWLEQLKINLHPQAVWDIGVVDAWKRGQIEPQKLLKLCEDHNIDTEQILWHNVGEDAYATMLATSAALSNEKSKLKLRSKSKSESESKSGIDGQAS